MLIFLALHEFCGGNSWRVTYVIINKYLKAFFLPYFNVFFINNLLFSSFLLILLAFSHNSIMTQATRKNLEFLVIFYCFVWLFIFFSPGPRLFIILILSVLDCIYHIIKYARANYHYFTYTILYFFVRGHTREYVSYNIATI